MPEWSRAEGVRARGGRGGGQGSPARGSCFGLPDEWGGVPLKSVQELLGHASIEMTMRYAHLSPAVNRDAVRALDTLGGDAGGDTLVRTTRNGS
ncbi:MAG: tyrosine-type recombinase/integrase [Myxococcota bacterium]